VNDQELARLPYHIETDRLGRIIMSPPPAVDHTKRLAEILKFLHELFPEGKVLAETPVSTSDGVKVMDAAWLSPQRADELDSGPCLLRSNNILYVCNHNIIQQISYKIETLTKITERIHVTSNGRSSPWTVASCGQELSYQAQS